MIVLGLLFILLFSSCSGYVQNIHNQFDREERMKRARYLQMQQRGVDRRPINNPVTIGSANTRSNAYPSRQREYQRVGKKRIQANDLKDNSSDGSLWSGKNSESFLFVTNNLKRKGDIVIIEVLSGLKGKIQSELKRSFPESPSKKKKGKGGDEAPSEAAAPAASNAAEDPNKVYDKISTTVVEQMNQDYLLVRGRKEILYKKFKRYFEIQAIVSQKDISSQDTITSTKLLEPKINVLRY